MSQYLGSGYCSSSHGVGGGTVKPNNRTKETAKEVTAADRSSITSPIISFPKGGGSIRVIGETFAAKDAIPYEVSKVNLSTPRPKGRGILMFILSRASIPTLKGGASRGRTGERQRGSCFFLKAEGSKGQSLSLSE